MSFASKGYVDGKVRAVDSKYAELITSGTHRQGVWNAATNTPTLSPNSGNNGYWYDVSVEGDWDGRHWRVGDRIIFNSAISKWDQIPTGVEKDDTPMLIGFLNENSSFPTTRPSGKPLLVGDYLKVDSAAVLPFEIDDGTGTKILFDSYMDEAEWNGSRFQEKSYKAGMTNEIGVKNPEQESISEEAEYQDEINKEFKNILINAVLESRKIAGIPLNKDITSQEIQDAIKDIAAELKNKTINADNNNITNFETDNFKNTSLAKSTDDVRNYNNSVDTKITTEKFLQKTLKNIEYPVNENDASNKGYVDREIQKVVDTTYTFKGFISLTEPVSNLKEGMLWYVANSLPTQFPINIKIYSNQQWSQTTQEYTPNQLDTWSLISDGHGYYWFGNEWNILDTSTSTVDNITIGRNLQDELCLKSKTSSDANKVWKINELGNWDLSYLDEWLVINTFEEVDSPNNHTLYILTQDITIDDQYYSKGFYTWDSESGYELKAGSNEVFIDIGIEEELPEENIKNSVIYRKAYNEYIRNYERVILSTCYKITDTENISVSDSGMAVDGTYYDWDDITEEFIQELVDALRIEESSFETADFCKYNVDKFDIATHFDEVITYSLYHNPTEEPNSYINVAGDADVYYDPNMVMIGSQSGRPSSSNINIDNLVLKSRKVANVPLSEDVTPQQIQNAIKEVSAVLKNKEIDVEDNNVIRNIKTNNIKPSSLATSDDEVRDYDNSVDTKLATEKFLQKTLLNVSNPETDTSVANKAYVDKEINDKLGSALNFKGFISLTEPLISSELKDGDIWYEGEDFPLEFPIQVKVLSNQQWSTTTVAYDPITLDMLVNLDSDATAYWIGNGWNILNEETKLDNVTLTKNGVGALEVKNGGISLDKLNPNLVTNTVEESSTTIPNNKAVYDELNKKVDKETFLNKLYHTGSIILTYNKDNPSTYIGGTWELIDEGYYLVATIKDVIDEQNERFKEAGLPNIVGEIYNVNMRGSSAQSISKKGAFSDSTKSNDNNIGCSVPNGDVIKNLKFDASDSNSIYGKSNTVQPKSVLVYMWKRTDEGTLTFNFQNLSFSSTDFTVGQDGKVYLRNGLYQYTPNKFIAANDQGTLISTDIDKTVIEDFRQELNTKYSKTETDNLLATKQNNLNNSQLSAVNSGIDTSKVSQIEQNRQDIQQLKDGMGSYVGYFETYADLAAYTGQVSENDYAVVGDDETHNHECWRYIYSDNQFSPQYRINEDPMTPTQMASINSGITSQKVAQIDTNTNAIADRYTKTETDALLAAKQNSLSQSQLDAVNSGVTSTLLNTIQSNITDRYTKTQVDDLLNEKQDSITLEDQPNNPTDNDYLSFLNGVVNKVWSLPKIFNYIKSKMVGAISEIVTSNLTANKALSSNSNGKIVASNVTNDELNLLSGLNTDDSLVLKLTQQVIENKTIDSDFNTISNIKLADFKSGVIQTSMPATPTDLQLLSAKGVFDYSYNLVVDYSTLSDYNGIVTAFKVGNNSSKTGYITNLTPVQTAGASDKNGFITVDKINNNNIILTFIPFATHEKWIIGCKNGTWGSWSNGKKYLHTLVRYNSEAFEYTMGWAIIINDQSSMTFADFKQWLIDNGYTTLTNTYWWCGGCPGTTTVRNSADTGNAYVGKVASGIYMDGTALKFKCDYNATVTITEARCKITSITL